MSEVKELDLLAVLTGSGLPSKEVSVVLNEALGASVHSAEQALRQVEATGDEKAIAKVQREYNKVLAEVKKSRYIVTVKAIPEQVKLNIREEISGKFPDETDLLGRPKPNLQGDRAFLEAMWQAHIVKIVGPDGASKLVDANEITALYNLTGAHVHSQINNAIHDLAVGSSEGFEIAFKELDFL